MLRLADLRGILRYVPQYRDKIFVIAADGAVVENANFRNLLLDIALLRSLRIGVVLVHGAGHQIQRLAQETGQKASNIDGTGITDEPTLQLALTAANRVTHEVLEGLSATDLRGVNCNALVAHPAGILGGVDHQHTGKVERIDISFLRSLLNNDIIPVIPPLGCDGEGNTFRLNSDAVAVELAKALFAVKLIFLTSAPGIMIRTSEGTAELLRHLPVEQAEDILRIQKGHLEEASRSKLANAVKAAKGGVPRVHIIDGREDEGLLSEVFSNEGVGTLVHANEYQAIRRAQKKDARAIFQLIKESMDKEELMPRTQAEIEKNVHDFFLFEVDGTLAGCIALHRYEPEKKAEMACVCVSPKQENQGIGVRLMNFVESLSRSEGMQELFCLSTQTFNYFVQKGGFRVGSPGDLPPTRQQRYEASGRRSQVLIKSL